MKLLLSNTEIYLNFCRQFAPFGKIPFTELSILKLEEHCSLHSIDQRISEIELLWTKPREEESKSAKRNHHFFEVNEVPNPTERSIYCENHWSDLPIILILTLSSNNSVVPLKEEAQHDSSPTIIRESAEERSDDSTSEEGKSFALLELTTKGIQFFLLPTKTILYQTIAMARDVILHHTGIHYIPPVDPSASSCRNTSRGQTSPQMKTKKSIITLRDLLTKLKQYEYVRFHDKLYNCQHFAAEMFDFFAKEDLFQQLERRWKKVPLSERVILSDNPFSNHLSLKRLQLVEMNAQRTVFLSRGNFTSRSIWFKYEKKRWYWTCYQNEKVWFAIEAIHEEESKDLKEKKKWLSQKNLNIIQYLFTHHPMPNITHSNTCCICFEPDQENLYALNCGNVHHVGMCAHCAKKTLQKKECPYCKQHVYWIFPIAVIGE